MSKHSRNSHKGQLEAIGLVIIVILISLGLLFFLTFSLRADSGPKSTFTSSQIATNFLNSAEKSTTSCGLTVRQLAQDCVSPLQPTFCTSRNGGQIDSCNFLKETISFMSDNTLAVWGKKYQFSVFVTGQPPVVQVENGECLGNRDSHSLSIPQQSGVGAPITMRIDVC